MRGSAQSLRPQAAMLLTMAARTTAKSTVKRPLLYVGDEGASLAVVKQVVACRKNVLLWRAADIDAARQVAQRGRPEVMLVDIDLAGCGVGPLMQLLRADPATQSTPILAEGADTAPAAAVKILEAGFFQYLAKPMQAGPLAEALDYALEFAALEVAEQSSNDSR